MPKAVKDPEKERKDEMELNAYEVSLYVNASRGVSPYADQFSGITNVKDVRERTRSTAKQIILLSLLDMLAKEGGEEWSACADLSDSLDHRFISKDGLGRNEAIMALANKSQIEHQITMVPQMPGQPVPGPQQEQKKKHWYNRG